MPGRLAVAREGKVLFYMPDPSSARAGGRLEPAWLPVFYNPRMELNRDLSVAALQVYIDYYASRKPVNVVEPLSATGVRALRYALEVEGVGRVYCGDVDYEAYRIIVANIGLNSAWHSVEASWGDANALMYSIKFRRVPVLVVDVDPFGPPTPFIEAALNLIGDGGLLMVTATDTAVLEGSKASKALRRYQARVARIPQSREVALRVLIGYIARVAAGMDKWVEPLISLYMDYYVRLYMLVRRGSKGARKTVESLLGPLYYCEDFKYASLRENDVRGYCSKVTHMGPLWTGDLFNEEFLEKVIASVEGPFNYLGTGRTLLKTLKTAREEAKLQGHVYQRLDSIASTLKTETPRREWAIETLRSRGFKAAPTHLAPTGLRTDAPLRDLLGLFPGGLKASGALSAS